MIDIFRSQTYEKYDYGNKQETLSNERKQSKEGKMTKLANTDNEAFRY